MNVESLKKIGGQVLLIVVGVLVANEIQKQIDKHKNLKKTKLRL